MADGSDYEINLSASSAGFDTAADEINRLAAGLDAAQAVSTSFDSAIAQAQALLASSSAAATQAADAVALGSTKYTQLEQAADRAAKAVEKAAGAGKDTSALQTKADDAAAAMTAQAAVLDELRAKSAAAAGAQSQLAASLKTLEAAAKAEAASLKAAAKEAEAMAKAAEGGGQSAIKAESGLKSAAGGTKMLDERTKKALGPMGEMLERGSAIKETLGASGWAGAAVVASAAVLALSAAVIVGVFALAKMAVEVNKGVMDRITKATAKAKEGFAKLFSGVHVEEFAKGVEGVTGMLDESSSSAKGVKLLLSTLLNPLFDSIKYVVPYVQEMFKGMVLGALMAAIVVIKLRNAVRGMIPPEVLSAISGLAGQVDWMKTALNAGIVVVAIFAVALGVLTVLLGVIAVAMFMAFAPLMILGVIVVAVIAIIVGSIIVLGAMIKWVVGLFSSWASSASSAAGDLISGLVNGIKSGSGMVFDAIKNLAGGAIGTLKSALGIASPSRVFMLAGGFTAEGFAEGVEDKSGRVEGAISDMAEPPDARKPQAQGREKSSAKSQTTITININASDGSAQGIAAAVRQVLTQIIEGDVTMLGGEASPA
jgi:hypothetical protein